MFPSPVDQAAVTRRIIGTLFVAQSLASAAFIANIAVNAIAGAQLSGNDALAGLPATLMLAGAALSAYPSGRAMQQFGRRPGLIIGMLLGIGGMLIDGIAVLNQSFFLFLCGLFLVGTARGITDQSRYAAADAVMPDRRAGAISTVVFAGTIGAVGGPLLVGPLGQLAAARGLPELTGPMFGGALLFAVAASALFLFLRPDPRLLSLRVAAKASTTIVTPPASARSLSIILQLSLARLGLISMVLGQVVMVLVMSVTSLHMSHHAHGLDSISLVIGAHTFGMYGLSMFTGRVADRLGRSLTIILGALMLIAGALIAPASLLTPWLALGLFLVGLGWNFCYIAGSSLLADAITPAERGSTQGMSDLLVNLGSAFGSLSSGFILSGLGYLLLCLFGAVLSLIPLSAALWWGQPSRRVVAGAD
ncbi:MFS transporter [Chloroflexus sp.]|uniref:MFS transporter n=1 Tax=Chloroflexus sp. TaxID=1904827 RepID=UPI002626F5A2|nr:MFS transporter [uncultured Chloroflexus sp.]